MEFIFYCYRHSFSVFKPQEVEKNYREMKEMGADGVSISLMETDFESIPRVLKKHMELIRDHGLKRYIGFGRWGGLFAAAPRSGSLFAIKNQDTLMLKSDGSSYIGNLSGYICCVNNLKFRKWFFELEEAILKELNPDGIILDEPKGGELPCFCKYCKGNEDPLIFRYKSLSKFLSDICEIGKSIKPDLETHIFQSPTHPVEYYEMCAKIPAVDFYGIDGPTSRQSCYVPQKKENVAVNKTPLEESIKTIFPIARKYGKKTIIVPENFYIPAGEEKNYYENTKRILLENTPDSVLFHYYGFENENPDLIMEYIRELISLVKN